MLSRTTRTLISSSTTATSACRRWASTLVVSEPLSKDGTLSAGTQSTVTAASQLGGDSLTLLVEEMPSQIPEGISNVLVYGKGGLSEYVSSAVQVAAEGSPYGHIVAPASKFGSTIVPRIAALLSLSPVTDVIEIVSPDTFVRPIYAGNALAKVQASDTTKLLSVRPTSFDKTPLVDAAGADVQELDVPAFAGSEFVSESTGNADKVDLGSASRIVSGGRALKSGDNFVLLDELATKLGDCAVGASRAAVDAGMAPNDTQVGQTGKVVAPDLYIAVGISGAIQHLSGMRDSKTIVAINTDPDAPIFSVADYGLKADLFEAVPELTGKL
mmetsp:Transcript_26414/g.39042  ORF Transcript_26414/g.39042 Transcript_26414/m.39042 type:complete len:328 (-) Transcript_26414:61-1044(-)